MTKVYIAGPDVFRPDASAWAASVHALCQQLGLDALVPLDGQSSLPQDIYAENIDMIRAADVVVANLNPFRGAEPDSGTCFEVGYALALGKPVIAYLDKLEPLPQRIERCLGQTLRQTATGWADQQGMQVENFGLPLNLMLAVPTRLICGTLEEALMQIEK